MAVKWLKSAVRNRCESYANESHYRDVGGRLVGGPVPVWRWFARFWHSLAPDDGGAVRAGSGSLTALFDRRECDPIGQRVGKDRSATRLCAILPSRSGHMPRVGAVAQALVQHPHRRGLPHAAHSLDTDVGEGEFCPAILLS